MAVSKNNPVLRDNQRLLVYCRDCFVPDRKPAPMKLVKRIPGGMFYVCGCGEAYGVSKQSYRDFPHEWVGKKGK